MLHAFGVPTHMLFCPPTRCRLNLVTLHLAITSIIHYKNFILEKGEYEYDGIYTKEKFVVPKVTLCQEGPPIHVAQSSAHTPRDIFHCVIGIELFKLSPSFAGPSKIGMSQRRLIKLFIKLFKKAVS